MVYTDHRASGRRVGASRRYRAYALLTHSSDRAGLTDRSSAGKTNNLLLPAIQEALQTGGMTDGALKTTTVGDDIIGLFALTLPPRHKPQSGCRLWLFPAPNQQSASRLR